MIQNLNNNPTIIMDIYSECAGYCSHTNSLTGTVGFVWGLMFVRYSFTGLLQSGWLPKA